VEAALVAAPDRRLRFRSGFGLEAVPAAWREALRLEAGQREAVEAAAVWLAGMRL